MLRKFQQTLRLVRLEQLRDVRRTCLLGLYAQGSPPRKCLAHVTWLCGAVNAVLEDGALLQRNRTDAIGRTALIAAPGSYLKVSHSPPSRTGASRGTQLLSFRGASCGLRSLRAEAPGGPSAAG